MQISGKNGIPQRHDTGSKPHHFSSVKEYYRKIYYEACDLLSGELQHRFQTKEIPLVVSMEQALIKAANMVDFQSELKIIGESCFKDDLDVSEHTAATSS